MAAQKIRRNLVRQLAFVAAAAACGWVTVWAYRTIDFGLVRWGLAIVMGIVTLVVFGYGMATAGVVACPACGKTITAVDTGRNSGVLCPHCEVFLSGERGMLDRTPATYVARSAVFGSFLPNQIVWPPGCCVCEQPATRMIESKLVDEKPGSPGRDMAVGIASLGVLKAVDRTTYTIQAPHCDQHRDGVELVSPKDIEISVAIAFRSYGYYVKFRDANRMPLCRLLMN